MVKDYKCLKNPTNEQRYEMLKEGLREVGRLVDFKNIIQSFNPPKDILNYGKAGQYKKVKIGIIGGGLAGMAAAFELRKLGCDITVYEARADRVGGRVYTYYFDEEKRYYGELGPLRIPVSHQAVWNYINLFGLNTIPFIQNNPNTFIYVNDVRVRNNDEDIQKYVYPTYNLSKAERNTKFSVLEDYAVNTKLNGLTPQVRSEILKIRPFYNPKYNDLINISLRQNFEMLGLSDDAMNMITSIDSLLSAQIYVSYSEALQDSYPVSYSYLYQIEGGNSNLPLAFYNSLTSNNPKEYNIPKKELGKVAWKSGNYVTGIYNNKDEEEVVLAYKNQSSDKELFESFDYVICTIPFTVLRTLEISPLFSNRKMQAIREINYEDGNRELLLCNRRFWEENKSYGGIIGGVSQTDLSISSIVYPSYEACNKTDPYRPGVLVGSYTLNLTASEIGDESGAIETSIVERQIERVHGLPRNYLNSVVTQTKMLNWNQEYWSRGALASFEIGQQAIFGYDMTLPEYNNRVFFAGEHISTSHGWMQGAIKTGMEAANGIAKQLEYQ